MDWDWGTGTAGLQPKPDKDQDWGRSEVWDCDWGRERQTVEVNGNGGLGGTESRFGRSPDHKTHKKNDRTNKKRQETRENRLDKTGHSDVDPPGSPCAAVDWSSRSPGHHHSGQICIGLCCVMCALHCTALYVCTCCLLSDDETPLV